MSDEGNYGPALSALSEKQRLFVWARATVRTADGARIKPGRAAQLAGYARGTNGGSARRRRKALDQTGWRLLQDARIVAAINEVASRKIESEGLASAEFLAAVRDDPSAPLMARLRAADSLLDRAGLTAPQEIAVSHTHHLSGDALLTRIRELAQKHGIDVDALLNAPARPMRLVDAPPR
jgi:hypothetical protein